ncbi:hypothetical protein [Butyrivibrio sp. FC2001]|uniref:hypothetical protein n=1 Tax=Butyrivibrio sp. FC2001 TaxID=1280671 RepID=UPI00047CA4BB|nr:hypothetical protein [Butyrivibrio sp. FC2001]
MNPDISELANLTYLQVPSQNKDFSNGYGKMRIDEKNWARCRRCGHKLYEIAGENGDIRIKCHSCKLINVS